MYLTVVIVVIQLVGCSFSASLSGNIENAFHRIALIRYQNNTLQHVTKHIRNVLERRKSADIYLGNIQDIYYYGVITVGTPSQKILVNFDTGSADLWFPSSKICHKNQTFCKLHRTYNHVYSRTYQENGDPFLIKYLDGSFASGFVSIDDINVGGVKVRGQLFGEVTHTNDDGSKYDGIFGLGFKSSSTIRANPPFVNMILQGAVKRPVFAFYLNKVEPSGDGIISGGVELVLGGVDPAHYQGDFTFTPVIEDWKISIDGVLLNTKQLSGEYPAVVDSGTTLIAGPSSILNPINKALSPIKIENGMHVVDCFKINTFPDVIFIINKRKFVLHAHDYIVKVLGENKQVFCMSGFLDDLDLPHFLLGDVFMRKFYTQFDMGNNRIGFAIAK